MRNNMPLRKVTVNKVDLLLRLEKNREKHISDYNNAVEEYKKTAELAIEFRKNELINELNNLLEKVKNKPIPLNIFTNLHFSDLNPPVSHENDYDEIIEMFKMEVNDKIELDSAEFSQYVMNNWTWQKEEENKRIFYAASQVGFAR